MIHRRKMSSHPLLAQLCGHCSITRLSLLLLSYRARISFLRIAPIWYFVPRLQDMQEVSEAIVLCNTVRLDVLTNKEGYSVSYCLWTSQAASQWSVEKTWYTLLTTLGGSSCWWIQTRGRGHLHGHTMLSLQVSHKVSCTAWIAAHRIFQIASDL